MEMCDSVTVVKFIVHFLHLQIGLGNKILNKFLGFIDSDMENFYTGEEVARNTLVTLNQVIAKYRKTAKYVS